MAEVRCPNCGKLLAEELRGYAKFRCARCKEYVEFRR